MSPSVFIGSCVIHKTKTKGNVSLIWVVPFYKVTSDLELQDISDVVSTARLRMKP